MNTYYTLAVLDDGQWGAQFGDYDHSVVEDERSEYNENMGYKPSALKIIRTAADQKSIDLAIDGLNSKSNATVAVFGGCKMSAMIHSGPTRQRQCAEVERRYGVSLVARQVMLARAANVTGVAFAERGLRQAAKRWFETAARELHMARILKAIA